jgi:uncharacterized UPF0160 family protein
MTDLRKAAEMALEVFEHLSKGESPAITKGELVYEIAALRQALAQPEQYDQTALELCEKCGWKAVIPDEGCLVCARNEHEPVGYVTDSGTAAYFLKGVDLDDDTPLYTAPPKREWVGLTDKDFYGQSELQMMAMKYAEAKLKEKNLG